jgi:hypothetical protein
MRLSMISITELVLVAVMLWTFIWEVLGMNLGYLARLARDFPQNRQTKTGIAPRCGHDRFIPNHSASVIHHSSYNSILYSLRHW